MRPVPPREETEGEPCATGHVHRVKDGRVRQRVAVAYHAPVPDDHALFALEVDRVLPAACRVRGDRPPAHILRPDPGPR